MFVRSFLLNKNMAIFPTDTGFEKNIFFDVNNSKNLL